LGILNNFVKELKILFSKVTSKYINVKEYVKDLGVEGSRVYRGESLFESNIMFPIGFVAIIGKVFDLINAGSIDILDVNIKSVITCIIGGVILNVLFDKMNTKDSAPKVGTKTKSSVPVMAYGAGSAESSPESDDADSKNKSLWEEFKDYCWTHKKEIGIVILVIVVAIIYGRYTKSGEPPKGPTGTPPGPTPPSGSKPKPETSDTSTQISDEDFPMPTAEDKKHEKDP
jgi:hypothetical protein